jgi:hypothetical protein
MITCTLCRGEGEIKDALERRADHFKTLEKWTRRMTAVLLAIGSWPATVSMFWMAGNFAAQLFGYPFVKHDTYRQTNDLSDMACAFLLFGCVGAFFALGFATWNVVLVWNRSAK